MAGLNFTHLEEKAAISSSVPNTVALKEKKRASVLGTLKRFVQKCSEVIGDIRLQRQV